MLIPYVAACTSCSFQIELNGKRVVAVAAVLSLIALGTFAYRSDGVGCSGTGERLLLLVLVFSL